MGDKWRDLVVENPMLIEITRFRRRYFKVTGGNAVNGVVMALIMICYAVLVLLVAENRTSIPPIALVQFETGLLCLFAPMVLYGAIAGERERRSWDLLLVAPISKAQIVTGKFMGAAAALGLALLFFQLPIAIATAFYEGEPFWLVVRAELLSVSFLLCVCAMTILFSARVKRGLMALGATLGVLMCYLIVFPTLVGVGSSQRAMTDISLYFHPFYVISRLEELGRGRTYVSSYDDFSAPPSHWWGWPQTFVYCAIAVVLLMWAINTLNFAENEVKFLPKGQQKDA